MVRGRPDPKVLNVLIGPPLIVLSHLVHQTLRRPQNLRHDNPFPVLPKNPEKFPILRTRPLPEKRHGKPHVLRVR